MSRQVKNNGEEPPRNDDELAEQANSHHDNRRTAAKELEWQPGHHQKKKTRRYQNPGDPPASSGSINQDELPIQNEKPHSPGKLGVPPSRTADSFSEVASGDVSGNMDSQQEGNDENDLLEDTFSFIMVVQHPEFFMMLLSCLIGWPCALFKAYICKLNCKKRNNEDEQSRHFEEGQPTTRGQENQQENEIVSLKMEENSVSKSLMDDQIMQNGPNSFYYKIVDKCLRLLPFWFAMAVFGTQIFIYLIVFLNFLDSEEGIPPNAPPLLRSGQILAFIISLFTQSDVLDAIISSSNGAEKLSEFFAKPYYNKAYVSNSMRFFAGSVGIATTFVLIISSTEIVELLLNFSAMEFVAGLDGIAFEVASQGFLGTTLARATSLVSDFRYSSKKSKHPDAEERKKTKRFFFFLIYVVVVLACFVLVWYYQAARKTVRNEVYVQFDDTDIPELFGVSGVYEGCHFYSDTIVGPIRYVPQGIICDFRVNVAAFVFCKEFKSWVYNYQNNYDPCNQDNFNLWSFKGDDATDSNAYDLATHADAQWFVRINDQGREIALEESSILIENRVDKFQDPFKGRCRALSFGAEDDNILFEKLDFDKDLQCPESYNYDDVFETMYDYLGLMHRSIFKRRKIGGGPEEFEVIIFNGLRWLLVELNIREFTNQLPEIYYSLRFIPVCESDDDFGCSWCIFVLLFKTDWKWLLNSKVANIEAISGPMSLFNLDDTGVPTSELKWYEPQKYLGTYIRPGRELPFALTGGAGPGGSLNVTANETDKMLITNSGEEFFFQCHEDRFKPNCPSGYKGISVLFGTDMNPWDNALLVYQNPDIFNLESSQTKANITVLDASLPKAGPFDLNGDDASIIEFQSPKNQYDISFCAPENGCTQLAFLDLSFNGLDPPGNYELYYGDEKSASFFPNPNPETKKVPEWVCKRHQIGTQCENANADVGLFGELNLCYDLVNYWFASNNDDNQ